MIRFFLTLIILGFCLDGYTQAIGSSPGFSPNKLIYYADISSVNRQIVKPGWSVDFYYRRKRAPQGFIFIDERRVVHEGEQNCKAPDYAYLDEVGIPREIDILPMSGKKGTITKIGKIENGTRVWWTEPGNWLGRGDKPYYFRNGSYFISSEGLLLEADVTWDEVITKINYAYDLPPEPEQSISSCYDLRLPKSSNR